MKGIVITVFAFIAGLCCTDKDAKINTEITGQWIWLSTYQGPWHGLPGPDSTYILSFSNEQSYQVLLNGNVINCGTYSTDSAIYQDIIDFYPGMGCGLYSTMIIGQLSIPDVSTASFSGDTLILINYPIHPESVVIYFRKL